MPSIQSKLKRLNAAKTYVILDTQVLPYQKLLKILPGLVHGGVGLVQLRDKFGHGHAMVEFAKAAIKITGDKALFIVNDRVDVALVAHADGVHVGQEDMNLTDVKSLVGSSFLVGKSCQNFAHARRAVYEGAHYIGFGSIFKTKTKPERLPMDLKVLQKVYKAIKIPIFPIGGITRENMNLLLDLGVNRIAICREVILAKQPGLVVRDINSLI